MSSIIERLTEGVVNRDMRAESHALLNKWERTGLLEGISADHSRNAMARLLENQAKELLRENSTMASGDVEGFAAVAFPIVRRVFAGLISNDLVSVQPMSLPSGLIFFLDFTFSPNAGGGNAGGRGRLGNIYTGSIYGGAEVASQITGGIDLLNARKADLGGPRTVGAKGYAYGQATGSGDVTWTKVDAFSLDQATEAQKKSYLEWDPDIMSLSGSGTVYAIAVAKAAVSLMDQLDTNNLAAITCSVGDFDGITSGKASLVRRLTNRDSDGNVQIVMIGLNAASNLETGSFATTTTVDSSWVQTDDFTSGDALGSVVGTTTWGLENSEDIPEIDIKVDSVAVTAMTKKLKAKWTPELGQDLNAYHNLDAEVELTSILSEQIALEIDREIIGDLVIGATAATYYWSRAPGLFVNRVTGLEIGASSAAPDFTGTVSEWYETLAETINDVSAQIHRKTLRGGANFVVCGPEVANILEFTAGFRASVTADDEKGSIGAVKVGALSKKFDVIVDPYFLRNVCLVGRRGSSFLESGYVYAPYVPLQTTPTIFGPEDFVPRKGVMTRYAKKMVRPDMYGLVVIRGLDGESGATS
jgi:hypothetical protein